MKATNHSNVRTIPATEDDLAIDDDIHPMDPNPPEKLSPGHPVIVDGIGGEARVGSLGGYSERIGIVLEEEHPDLGKEFRTKHFEFICPGVVEWGYEGKTFKIHKIV